MTFPICTTCGVQHDEAHFDLEHCAICTDERQYVGWGGQRWTTLEDMAEAHYRAMVRPEGELTGIGTEPSFAIGQRALLVPGSGGNVLWDCVSYVDSDAIAAVHEQGGIAAIAISHPHFYGSAVSWSEAFGNAPIYVHSADREWVRRDGNFLFWDGDVREILPGRTLINAGVHFPGGTVLHWAEGADGAGALCTGDIFTVVMDRRFVSFMYSYPNHIPEPPTVIRRALQLIDPWEFATIYGGWWQRVVETDGKAAVQRSAQRYLNRLGLPIPTPPNF